MTETYGMPAARSAPRAAIVFTSCIRARVPSCIRAPPEALTTTRGIPSASAPSAARVTFSPTTDPIEPPMNVKSRAQIATRRPARAPKPQIAASRRPVAVWAATRRSRYGLLSTKPSGSRDTRPASRSRKVPGSRSWARRAGAEMRKWWPHDGQTRSALSRCLLKSISLQPGHWVHMSGG